MRPERVAVAAALALVAISSALAAPVYGFGRPARPDEIAGWDIDVAPDGAGLPPGHGDVAEGEALFAKTCAACHGEGGAADRLVGGQGSLATPKPIKTVGSYWPYATTLFDYVRRAMPYTAPQSLSPNQVYGLVAYLLWCNGIVPRGTRLDQATLARVRMPNRNGFDPVEPPTRADASSADVVRPAPQSYSRSDQLR
jgi:S-disulfanyl-L-cysteine oxidoreductase SoxD